MKLQRRFLIFTAIVFGLSACTSTSIERTSDATAVSASTTNVYSESSLTSSSTVYFSYDNYNIDSIGSDTGKSRQNVWVYYYVSCIIFTVFQAKYLLHYVQCSELY